MLSRLFNKSFYLFGVACSCLSWDKTNWSGGECRIDVGGIHFLLLRITPYLAGNPVKSQGLMMSYANDVITRETHINTGYLKGVP